MQKWFSQFLFLCLSLMKTTPANALTCKDLLLSQNSTPEFPSILVTPDKRNPDFPFGRIFANFRFGPQVPHAGMQRLTDTDGLGFGGSSPETYDQTIRARRALLDSKNRSFYYSRLGSESRSVFNRVGKDVLDLVLKSIQQDQPDRYIIDHKKETITDIITKESWDISGAKDPLLTAARLVEEDLLILKPIGNKITDRAGFPGTGPMSVGYYEHQLIGGVLASPTNWSIRTRDGFNGLTISEIHHTGVASPKTEVAVPFAQMINRVLTKLSSDLNTIFIRNNFFIYGSSVLNHHLKLDIKPDFENVSSENAGDRLFLRVERQTLRGTLHTGYILFTIKPHVYRLSDLVKYSPYKAAELLTALENVVKVNGPEGAKAESFEMHLLAVKYIRANLPPNLVPPQP